MTFVNDLSLCTFSEFWTTWLPLPISPSISLSTLGGFDSRYDDGEGKDCYDFVGSSLRCRLLAWVIGLNVPNSFFDHHPLLDFGLMIPNPQPTTPLSGLAGFFFSWSNCENMVD